MLDKKKFLNKKYIFNNYKNKMLPKKIFTQAHETPLMSP